MSGEPGLERPTRSLPANLLAGMLTGIVVVIMSVTLAALIFSGPLSEFVGEGITLAINTVLIAGLVTTLLSRCKPVVAMVDEDTAPVFALLTAYVVTSLPLGAAPGALYIAALAAIVATTLLTGFGLALLGILRVGKFVQFLPHSVMGGYFSAVGWLLIMGGLHVSTHHDPSTLEGLRQIADAQDKTPWLLAIVTATWLLILRRRVPLTVLLPGTVVMACGAWFAAQWMAGLTPDEVMTAGQLLGPFGEHGQRLLQPLAGLNPGQVQWWDLVANSGTIASIFLIAILSLMLAVSGLGFLTRTELDMNHELRVAGLSNVASGLGGGMIGLPSFSLSSLALDMGAEKNRWVGMLVVVGCVLAFLFGLDWLAYTPRFVLGGILIYMGLMLVRAWLIEGWRKFSPLEYPVIPIILAVSIAAGFLQGILVGLVAAIVLFVVKYSQTRVVAYAASGAALMSNVDRTAAAQAVIQQNGDRNLTMSLQGYLFFGTAGQVYDRVQARLQDQDCPPLRNLLVDFSRVTGLDASAAQNFERILRRARAENFMLILTGLKPEMAARLHRGGFGASGPENLAFHEDLDHALEWSENQLLAEFPPDELNQGCFEQLASFLSPAQIDELMSFLARREVEAGEILAQQGDQSNQLFFLET
ncbi:MAG: SulP family inorganic anion transporter, partial [Xanthomonadales bacterium]|nr:SulP family inorganic anion transporter [Xanthomonadales bacterium]